METTINTPTVITSEALLAHWQGHRSLTRRVIEAFPEDRLFGYSIGGMRPFAGLALEMISMAGPGVRGAATGNWDQLDELGHRSGKGAPDSKEALLEAWDRATEQINVWWPQIPAGRFQETDNVFNAYPATICTAILYLIDNEIHHRGQGYVYLRALGIEPPAFWER